MSFDPFNFDFNFFGEEQQPKKKKKQQAQVVSNPVRDVAQFAVDMTALSIIGGVAGKVISKVGN